jgi:hypothetical protein
MLTHDHHRHQSAGPPGPPTALLEDSGRLSPKRTERLGTRLANADHGRYLRLPDDRLGRRDIEPRPSRFFGLFEQKKNRRADMPPRSTARASMR